MHFPQHMERVKESCFSGQPGFVRFSEAHVSSSSKHRLKIFECSKSPLVSKNTPQYLSYLYISIYRYFKYVWGHVCSAYEWITQKPDEHLNMYSSLSCWPRLLHWHNLTAFAIKLLQIPGIWQMAESLCMCVYI